MVSVFLNNWRLYKADVLVKQASKKQQDLGKVWKDFISCFLFAFVLVCTRGVAKLF